MKKSRRTDSPPVTGSNRLRIIGGRWRGRKLTLPTVAGLRPTPDRVRETLFNWLAPVIEGARCLDLFAGSGALGLEALSRGAAHTVFVDSNPEVVSHLQTQLTALDADGETHSADALHWLQTAPARQFDIVFLDPPFSQQLLGPVCTALADGNWLAPQARVYLESERALTLPPLPAGWQLHREKTAGEVCYRLVLLHNGKPT